jgi:hypothetical protein
MSECLSDIAERYYGVVAKLSMELAFLNESMSTAPLEYRKDVQIQEGFLEIINGINRISAYPPLSLKRLRLDNLAISLHKSLLRDIACNFNFLRPEEKFDDFISPIILTGTSQTYRTQFIQSVPLS